MSATSQKSKAEAHCEAQCEKILASARKCFVESGFHAANMASIAQTAGMSAGLIYRYFQSKNAIILAIIAQHLDEVQADIRQLPAGIEQIKARIEQRFINWRDHEASGLEPGIFLEIAALATREPQVAEALRLADDRIRAELGNWLLETWQRAGYTLNPAEVAERVFALQSFIEGLIFRAIKQPGAELELVGACVSALLAYLLPVGQKSSPGWNPICAADQHTQVSHPLSMAVDSTHLDFTE